jgi:hypothetical protein
MSLKSIQVESFRGIDDTELFGFPETLAGVMSKLNDVCQRIPEEWRGNAKIIFSHSSFGVDATVFYERPETDDDIEAEAVARERTRVAEENREREQYEALKRKFG